MGSMHTGLEEAKDGFERMAAFYAARARGEAGLMVTGGIAPNRRGALALFGSKMSSKPDARRHKTITQAVHDEGGRICMQILHAGRYGYHPFIVAPSRIKASISPYTPWKLTVGEIKWTIKDFVHSAVLSRMAGYDGIEIMGSEGYLINQFIAKRTNIRTDDWGGSYENRLRFPLEIVKQTRKAVGKDFIIIFRLSMLDLVEEGSSWEEIVQFAKLLEEAGVSIINTGIGWHEARIPTIASMVPEGAFIWVTQRLKEHIKVPLITTNRINNPDQAEAILAANQADMISMARPFLADAEIVKKSRLGKAKYINTCIACNQACLDQIFNRQIASCLVNPVACHETIFIPKPTNILKNLAVIGGGPAGMSAAVEAAKRGHRVVLFEESNELGGQFKLAKEIPGKEVFKESIRYFTEQLKLADVELRMNTRFTTAIGFTEVFDEIILAAGVRPRQLNIQGIDHPKVLSYPEAILHPEKVGKSVAIIGAGGIGFDVATQLLHQEEGVFEDFWGIDKSYTKAGGIKTPKVLHATRKVWLLQRSPEKIGRNLGKTTGWIHRLLIKRLSVTSLAGVNYKKIDDEGFHILYNDQPLLLPVDTIIICAGQESNNELYDQLQPLSIPIYVIGGALLASELDAKRAIEEGTKLGMRI